MQLTPEVLRSADEYLNPCHERELSLRGLKLKALENLGVTNDRHECLDLCDNDLTQLDGFPPLARLRTILAANNQIASISSSLAKQLPALSTLILTNNRLAGIDALLPLSQCVNLTTLVLLGNPVCPCVAPGHGVQVSGGVVDPRKVEGGQSYRYAIITLVPSLQMLDFQRIKPSEREAAKALFTDQLWHKVVCGQVDVKHLVGGAGVAAAAAAAVEEEDQEQQEEQQGGAKDVPRKGKRTPEETQAILEAIKAATSASELDTLAGLLARPDGRLDELRRESGDDGPTAMDESEE